MKADRLILSYRRVPKSQLMVGKIALEQMSDSNLQYKMLDDFARASFGDMLRMYAGYMKQMPEAVAIIARTDRQDIPEIAIDKHLSDWLRSDTEEAIRSMECVIITPTPETKTGAPGVLTVGSDAFAETFGERLYSRVREVDASGRSVECFGCGKWQSAGSSIDPRAQDDLPGRGSHYFTCLKCGLQVKATYTTCGRWGWAYTKDLLHASKPGGRFFFPRGWNRGTTWVSYEKLKRLWDEYNEEVRHT